MDRRDQLLNVIDSIYEASLDTTCFQSMLKDVCDFVGGISADYYIQRDDRVLFNSYFGVPEELDVEYLANYHGENPRVPMLARAPEMQIITDQEYLDESETVVSPMFQEFLPKAGLRDMLALIPARSSLGYVMTAVHLPKGKGPPDNGSIWAMSALMPHMRRLSQIRMRLMEQEFRAKRLEATIDLLSTGVILINRRGQVAAMNQAAESLLDGSKVLRIEKGFLRPSRSVDRLKLERCIANALDRENTLMTPGGAFRIDDFQSGESLSLIISPLPCERQDQEDLGAVIYVSDGRATVSELAQQRLQSLWGLTPAEARVAAAVACGIDLKTHASRFDVSVHTARTQLKQALAKTGSRRQTELTRLVLLGPAYLTDPVV